MGRQKPRKDRRPPPKRPAAAQAPNAAQHADQTHLPYLAQPRGAAGGGAAGTTDYPAFPPLPPMHGGTTTAEYTQSLHNWSTSALGKVGKLPKLSPNQLNAIIQAAAGLGDSSLLNHPSFAAAMNGAAAAAAAGGAPGAAGAGAGGIDLPASLAALFEAKLTLDREKAKLVRMQKELKGYKEGVACVNRAQHTHGHTHDHGLPTDVDDDAGDGELLECSCGHDHHYDDDDELYEYTDEECDGGCECDCHSHHHHSHDGHYDDGEDDEYEDDPDADYVHDEDDLDDGPEVFDQQTMADAARWDGGADKYFYNTPAGGGDANLFQKAFARMTPEQQRQLVGMAQSAQAAQPQSAYVNVPRNPNPNPPPVPPAQAAPPSKPLKPLSEDPDRLDEAVRELFNWIKAVVWTIEQAALVAGRGHWAAQEAR